MRGKTEHYSRSLSLPLTLTMLSCMSTTPRDLPVQHQGDGVDLLGGREQVTPLYTIARAGHAAMYAQAGGAAELDLPPRAETTQLRGAVGFTLDPETFLMSAEGDYFVNENLGVGPLFQLGLSDRRVIVAPTANVRGVFDLSGSGLDRLKPFAQGGVGLAYIHKDRDGDDDDVGFLLNFGFGADYHITERFALGNSLLFNIMPDKVRGENFFFSWQFVSATFRF